MPNNRKGTILIIDDDPFFSKMKKEVLEEAGYRTDFALNAEIGLEKLRSQAIEVVILDLNLAGQSGLDIIPRIKTIDPTIIIVMLTGQGTIHTAVRAVKSGAYDFITKDLEDEEILLRIEKAFEKRNDLTRLMRLRESLRDTYSFHNIIGSDKKMLDMYKLITTVCDTDVTVLIKGATGTGKELVARAVHFNSLRKDEPFIDVNCAAISESLMESEIFGHEKGAFTGAFRQKPGKIELANKGTLFLDEIGDMSIGLQAKLLRFLQDKTFERVGGTQKLTADVRIISATHQDLEKLSAQGKFRTDLFYRLNVVRIELPPLRDRVSDLPLLTTHFIKQANARFNKKVENFSPEAQKELSLYDWPGNIRELENLVNRAVLTSTDKIINRNAVIKCLSPASASRPKIGISIDTSLSLDKFLNQLEKQYLQALFTQYESNIGLIAKKARQTERSIYYKVKKYALSNK